MYKIIISLSAVIASLSFSFAQNISFPDAAFKAALVNYSPKIDTNNDKEISVSEALAYTGKIDVYSGYITSLVGIEAFKNITQLTSFNNKLTSIDVSNNTALTVLKISNAGITSLDVSKNTALVDLECPFNQLSSLDISKNTALTNLDCSQNQLTTLNVTNNVALTNLNCSLNQLTSIEVSKHIALKELNCSQNQISTLDVSKNINLEKLSCGVNSLSVLDISKNINLLNLSCFTLNITSLDLSNNPLLTFLNCFNNKLTTIDLSKNTLLQEVNCGYNLITSLYFFNHTSLKTLRTENNNLTSLYVSGATVLKQLNASQNAALTTICYDKSQDTTTWVKNTNTIFSSTCGEIVKFNDNNFKNELVPITEINTNADSEIQVSEANAFVGELYLNNKSISSLQGIEHFTKISALYCDFNQIKSLDLSKNTLLTNLQCSINQLTSLNITKNTSLTKLNCSSNQLANLDISKNLALTELSFSDNQITTINVSNHTALSILNCGINKIQSLDVSKNTALVNLFCGSNLLSNINVSNNTLLTSLSVSGNQLSTIDLSKNLLLQELECFSNKFDRLDVSKNTALISFSAFNMPSLYLVCINPIHNTTFWTIDQTAKYSLVCNDDPKVRFIDANLRTALIENPTKIDTDNDNEISIKEAKAFTGKIEIQYKQITNLTGIEEFVNLAEIDASGNTLTNLNLANNKALTSLLCGSCKLTSVNLSNHPQLAVLALANNQLKNVDISKNTALTYFGAPNNQLKSIDVSANVLLTEINVENNQLISIDVSKNVDLNYLDCGYNALTRLDVTNNPNLITVYCSSNPALKTICISNQVTTSWSKDNTMSYSKNCTPVTSFTDVNFKNALLNHIPKIDSDNDGEISITEANNYIGEISVSNKGIENLVGIESFKNITTLNVSGNQLKSVDFSKNTKLKVLIMNNNPLGITATRTSNRTQNSVTIDLSQNLELEELNCSNNNLTDLDLSKHVLLKKLDCSQNPLLSEIYIQLQLINQDFIKDQSAVWKSATVTNVDSSTLVPTATVVKAYNLQGMEVPIQTKGEIIILLYSDGTTQKVFQD